MENFNVNDVRYALDFDFIPEMFYDTPAEFFNALERGKEMFFCEIFNNFYSGVNEKLFEDSPIVFKPEDFKVTKYLLAKSKFLYHVDLPEKHDSSKVWCESYGFAFDLKIVEESKFKFFTVEKSNIGTHMLCGVTPDKKHINYGNAAETMDDNVNKMLKIMFKD